MIKLWVVGEYTGNYKLWQKDDFQLVFAYDEDQARELTRRTNVPVREVSSDDLAVIFDSRLMGRKPFKNHGAKAKKNA